MPDLLLILVKKWKFIFGLSFLAAILALIIALITPKQYLAIATALPVNSVLSDKASIFNQNIQGLYSDIGSPDELDKIEGTASLDTIFIAAAQDLNLAAHYSIPKSKASDYRAAMQLKKHSKINRSAYGELKVKVWDEDRMMAAILSNYLLQKLQQIHQGLLNTINLQTLARLKEVYAAEQNEYVRWTDSLNQLKGDTSTGAKPILKSKVEAIADELKQYQRTIRQYQLAVNANVPALLIVEKARAPLLADKPDILLTVIFSFAAAFFVSFFIMLFVETRNHLF